MDTPRSHIELGGPMSLSDYARTHIPRAAEWADDFVLSLERAGPAERGRLYRSIRRGELVVVRPGVYLPEPLWSALSVDERYLVRIRGAALATREPLVFAAESAGALWRLPVIGPWPMAPVVAADRAAGGRSTRALAPKSGGGGVLVQSVDKRQLLDALSALATANRHVKAAAVIEFADGDSGRRESPSAVL